MDLGVVGEKESRGRHLMSLRPLTLDHQGLSAEPCQGFLGSEGTPSQALASRPRSPAPLEPVKLFFMFSHTIYATLSREWPIAPHAH
jgi:hypothetical protein